MLPAALVPVATEVRRIEGHGDEVAGAGRDVAVAPGAEVRLAGLVGLHPPYVDGEAHRVGVDAGGIVRDARHGGFRRSQAKKAQAMSSATITSAAPTIT